MNRRKFIKSAATGLFIPVFPTIVRAQSVWQGGSVIKNMTFAGTGATCSLWQSQTQTSDFQDYFNLSQIGSQKIRNQNGTTTTICKVSVQLSTVGLTGGNAKIQLRTASNGGGTQYGTDSITVAVPASTTDTYYDFTWSANPTVPATTDFFINVVPVGSLDSYLDEKFDPNSYVSSAYGVSMGSTDRSASSDMCFKIFSQ